MHIYNHVYLDRGDADLKDFQCVIRPDTSLSSLALEEYAAVLSQCDGKAVVCSCNGDETVILLYYLVRFAGMSFPNAYVFLSERLNTYTLNSLLLPDVVRLLGLDYSDDTLQDPRFFYHMLSTVSYTPSPILPDLYAGSLGTLGHQSDMRSLGIQAVLRVDDQYSRSSLQWADDFTLLDLPTMNREHIPEDILHQGVAFIHTQRNSGHTVLVHCVGGVNRSVTFVLAYLIECLGMSLADAYALVVLRRVVARPHGKLLGSLVQCYELSYQLNDAYKDDFPDRLLEEAQRI
jgi:hypothetical protein